MIKTKQRRGSDDAQTAIIAELASGCRVEYGDSPKPNPVATPNHAPRRPPPRTTRLREMLSTDRGANLHEICLAFGWQPHSARAALSGLRKSGTAVERITFAVSDDKTGSSAEGLTRYRITLTGGAAS